MATLSIDTTSAAYEKLANSVGWWRSHLADIAPYWRRFDRARRRALLQQHPALLDFLQLVKRVADELEFNDDDG